VLVKNIRILTLILVFNGVKKARKINEAPHIGGQVYRVPHGILLVFSTIHGHGPTFRVGVIQNFREVWQKS
jgi:hypothetical protein